MSKYRDGGACYMTLQKYNHQNPECGQFLSMKTLFLQQAEQGKWKTKRKQRAVQPERDLKRHTTKHTWGPCLRLIYSGQLQELQNNWGRRQAGLTVAVFRFNSEAMVLLKNHLLDIHTKMFTDAVD